MHNISRQEAIERARNCMEQAEAERAKTAEDESLKGYDYYVGFVHGNSLTLYDLDRSGYVKYKCLNGHIHNNYDSHQNILMSQLIESINNKTPCYFCNEPSDNLTLINPSRIFFVFRN
jgi:hypothetical protein